MRKRALVGIFIAVVLVASVIPVAYSYMQRVAATSLSFKFNKIELAKLEMPENPLNKINEGESDGQETFDKLLRISIDESYKNQVYTDLILNTKFNYNLYFEAQNPSYIDAVVDRAEIRVTVSGHELEKPIIISKEQTIPAGGSSTVLFENVAFSLSDVARVVSNTISDDYRLTVDLAITSHYPTLFFGEILVPTNVNIKSFIVPPKPIFDRNNGGFSMVGENVNSYSITIRNPYEVPLSGKLQVGAYAGTQINIGNVKVAEFCQAGCTPKGGFSTLIRTWLFENQHDYAVGLINAGGQIVDPFSVTNYENIGLASGDSHTFTVANPELRSNSLSSFVLRWEPDYSKLPYIVTVSRGNDQPSIEKGVFDLNELTPHIGESGVSLAKLGEQAAYYLIRDFGYLGHVEFRSANYEVATFSPASTQPLTQAASTQPVQSQQFLQTSLDLQASPSYVDDSEIVTIHGRLATLDGKGIASERIDIKQVGIPYLELVFGSVYTDTNGYYEFQWLADRQYTNDGRISIFAIHEQTSSSSRSESNRVTVMVNYVPGVSDPIFQTTTLSMVPSSYTADNGEELVFTGLLRDEDGNGVGNEQIQIQRTNCFCVTLMGTGYTASDGSYSISIEADIENANSDGTADVYALHEQSKWYGLSSSDIARIQINRMDTDPKPGYYPVTLTLEVYDPEERKWGDRANIEDGRELRFRGSLIDNEGDPVPSEIIYLQERDFPFFENLESTMTDSEGRFSFEWRADYEQADGDGNAEFFAMHVDGRHYGYAVSNPDLYIVIYK